MKLRTVALLCLASIILSACGSNPTRISANAIPSWCNDIEKTGVLSKLTPQIVEKAVSGEKFLACGSGTGNAVSSSRDSAVIDAKKQILDQLIGRLITKYNKNRLVDDHKDLLSYSSFGYDIIEQKVFDIEGGYQTFILIETSMDDLKGTKDALLKERFDDPEGLVSEKY
jgi:hypothetical protein